MTIGKAIAIISWAIEKYENVKSWITKKYRAHKTRRVRNLIDDNNVDAIDDIVRNIKKKRRNRRDAS